MIEIYAKARHVITWLGEADDDSDRALEVIRLIGENPVGLLDVELAQQAILRLLQRPWFWRIRVRCQKLCISFSSLSAILDSARDGCRPACLDYVWLYRDRRSCLLLRSSRSAKPKTDCAHHRAASGSVGQCWLKMSRTLLRRLKKSLRRRKESVIPFLI